MTLLNRANRLSSSPDFLSKECRNPLRNQQRVVYEFKCNLCGSSYVGYTRRHLFYHRYSAVGKYLPESHNRPNMHEQFNILKKCRGKLERLIYEMLLIKERRPTLNTQADSIRAKPFN